MSDVISGYQYRARPPLLVKGVDHRSLRVLILILAVGILNALDLIYTVFAQDIGSQNHVNLLNEMNPFTAVFLQNGLLPSLICFKILMVVCGLGMLWKLRHSRLTIPACWVLLLAYAWLGVVWVQWVHTINRVFELRLTSAAP